MNKAWIALVSMLWLATPGLRAQTPAPPSPVDATVDVEGWLRENLDDDLFSLLFSEVDFQRVHEVFGTLLKKFDANDVYDLASAREAAAQLLPLLKQFEETLPYATWLENQLDYLEVSEILRREVKPVPPKPGLAPVRPAPSPEAQRPVWEKRLSPRPWPASAETLVPRLKPIFRSVGVPAELIWLAEVESSFNAKAQSPKGAAGLFQLMPATARSLGLSTTWPFDERFEVENNARAAAKYLRYLHQRFGDWRLALAAYNAGEGRVSNLLAREKTKSFVSIAPSLPAETQLYVPRFEATLRKREGVALNRIGPPKNLDR